MINSQNSAADWIWQQSQWPNFYWDETSVSGLLSETETLQSELLGRINAAAYSNGQESQLDALLQNIIQSSAIEGETLNAGSVRSSLAKRLGVDRAGIGPVTAQSEGLAELLIDATQNYDEPLSLERLYRWHSYLFPDYNDGTFHLEDLNIGELRGPDDMQVVSGPHNHRTVHFLAPPRAGLEKQLQEFIDWLNQSRKDTNLHPTLRAGLAHLWFVTLHPFDDGNGRLARAINDYALAQSEHQSVRFYAVAASIMEHRRDYYAILESTQKSTLNITPWLTWFLTIFRETLLIALNRIGLVLVKARFWQLHGQSALNQKQVKVLNRLLDAGPDGFEGGLSAAKYKSMADVSKATATRHISELLQKQCIAKSAAGGRSTRYEINWPKLPEANTPGNKE